MLIVYLCSTQNIIWTLLWTGFIPLWSQVYKVHYCYFRVKYSLFVMMLSITNAMLFSFVCTRRTYPLQCNQLFNPQLCVRNVKPGWGWSAPGSFSALQSRDWWPRLAPPSTSLAPPTPRTAIHFSQLRPCEPEGNKYDHISLRSLALFKARFKE